MTLTLLNRHKSIPRDKRYRIFAAFMLEEISSEAVAKRFDVTTHTVNRIVREIAGLNSTESMIMYKSAGGKYQYNRPTRGKRC